jgi:hypothetical protein
VRRPTGRISGIVAILLVVTGCGGPAPTTSPSSSSAPTPGTTTAPTSPPPPATAGASAGSVEVDDTLLEFLPAEIEGIERRADTETAVEIAAASGLDASAEGIAVAIYVGPLATDTPGDYAVATVVRLRDGVFDDAWFRAWRDSFDAGVCEQAGGVDPGRSEVEIEGRDVHRSTCVGGVVIHHVFLDGPGVVVSVQGAGPADLGRRVVASVKE